MVDTGRYDAIILGSGLAGSILAAILAKQGHSVLVVERGSHPRFAIGESMLPQSAMWMWILGTRFDIPEIVNLADTVKISRAVSRACGQKKVIGFLYHNEGEEQGLDHAHQLVPPNFPFFSESHLYREEVDLYMLQAAQRYGVTYMERTEMTDFHLSSDEVWIDTRTDGDDEVKRSYGKVLIDASGFRSPIAQRLDMREEPSSLRTRSRTIFNHFVDMQAYDDTPSGKKLPRHSRRWHDGTLHHVFDGGWFWIIPFGNHMGSDSRLTSIGLTLDMDKFPLREGVSPEQEFWEIVERFPSVREHFEGMRPIRSWIRTPRLQYSSTHAVDNRLVLLPHAYGFVDPLYSAGLVSTLEHLHALAVRLLPALAENDLSAKRFADIDTLLHSQLHAADQMIACSYRSMAAFPLWNAWIQLWLGSVLLGDTWIFRSCLHYLSDGDVADWDALSGPMRPVSMAPFAEQLQGLIDLGDTLLDRYERGELTANEAAEELRAAMADAEWLPKSIYRWGEADERHLDLVPERLRQYIAWGQGPDAPAWLRENLFDFDLSVLGPAPLEPTPEESCTSMRVEEAAMAAPTRPGRPGRLGPLVADGDGPRDPGSRPHPG
jgi:FADH2 O2-dependent halogenase